MIILFFAVASIAIAMGFALFLTAPAPIQQMVGAILLHIGVTALGFGAIIRMLESSRAPQRPA